MNAMDSGDTLRGQGTPLDSAAEEEGEEDDHWRRAQELLAASEAELRNPLRKIELRTQFANARLKAQLEGFPDFWPKKSDVREIIRDLDAIIEATRYSDMTKYLVALRGLRTMTKDAELAGRSDLASEIEFHQGRYTRLAALAEAEEARRERHGIRVLIGALLRSGWLSFLDLTCGYGRRRSRVLILLLCNWLAFALLYSPPLGVLASQVAGAPHLEWKNWGNTDPGWGGVGYALFFSGLVITSLGTSDVVPVSALAEAALVLQLALSYLTLGLFVGLVVDSLSRFRI